MRLMWRKKEAPVNPWIEMSLILNSFKGRCLRDVVPVSLVRMRSPVQIWLAAPKRTNTIWCWFFFVE